MTAYRGSVDNLPAFLIDAIENDYAKDHKPADPKVAELRAEARRCWNNYHGAWTTYKGANLKYEIICVSLKLFLFSFF